MPRFDRDAGPEGPVVRGFAQGGFVVGEGIYRALLLTPVSVEEWSAPPLADLALDHLGSALSLEPQAEFLLLGTGPRLAFPGRALRESLDRLDIGIEAMDSRAAARAWGLLRSEGRWIAAALMPL